MRDCSDCKNRSATHEAHTARARAGCALHAHRSLWPTERTIDDCPVGESARDVVTADRAVHHRRVGGELPCAQLHAPLMDLAIAVEIPHLMSERDRAARSPTPQQKRSEHEQRTLKSQQRQQVNEYAQERVRACASET